MSTRLAKGGRLIDRSTPITFTFNGKSLKGHAGDTLASALLANDQRAATASTLPLWSEPGFHATAQDLSRPQRWNPIAFKHILQGCSSSQHSHACASQNVASNFSHSSSKEVWPSKERSIFEKLTVGTPSAGSQ